MIARHEGWRVEGSCVIVVHWVAVRCETGIQANWYLPMGLIPAAGAVLLAAFVVVGRAWANLAAQIAMVVMAVAGGLRGREVDYGATVDDRFLAIEDLEVEGT